MKSTRIVSKDNSLLRILFGFLVAMVTAWSQGAVAGNTPGSAIVSVSIVNSGGKSLNDLARREVAKVKVFRNVEQGENLAPRFVNGVAKDIPFGSYAIEVDAEGMEPFRGVVDVETPEMFLKVGLAWYGVENDLIFKNVFRGTVSGGFKNGHCRASGVYLRWQYDALVNPQTGWFDFGAVRPGTYSVVCVIDDKPIPFGIVDINASSSPLRFEIPKTSDSTK